MLNWNGNLKFYGTFKSTIYTVKSTMESDLHTIKVQKLLNLIIIKFNNY